MTRRSLLLFALIVSALTPAAFAQRLDPALRAELRAIDFRIIGGRAFWPDYEYVLVPEQTRIIPRGDHVYELALSFIRQDPDELFRNRDTYKIKLYITLYYDGRQFILFNDAHDNKVQPWNVNLRKMIDDKGSRGVEHTITFSRSRDEREYERGGNRYDYRLGDLRIVFRGQR